jgi:uncharacterized membrane protein
MNLRLAIEELSRQHELSPEDRARLIRLAELNEQPRQLRRRLPLGVAIVAAALAGLGVIFWVAANWDALSRTGRFGLLEILVCASCLGALFRPTARVPLGLFAFLGAGALLALFGQTYQTGADPGQLFAWWSVLTLPLCLGVRHDALWAGWAAVGMTALGLFARAYAANSWTVDHAGLIVHLLEWSGALLLTFSLSPLLARYTGAGPWSLRLCALLSTVIISASSLDLLFTGATSAYGIGLGMLGGTGFYFSQGRRHDPFALSVLALGIDFLLVAGFGRMLFHGGVDSPFKLLLLGLVAAALLGATVKLVLALSRQPGVKGGAE